MGVGFWQCLVRKPRDSRSSLRTCLQLQGSLYYSEHDTVTSLLEPCHSTKM